MEHLKPSNLFILTLRLAAPHKELSEFCRRCYEVCAHTPSDADAVVIADNGFRDVGAIAALGGCSSVSS